MEILSYLIKLTQKLYLFSVLHATKNKNNQKYINILGEQKTKTITHYSIVFFIFGFGLFEEIICEAFSMFEYEILLW